MGRLVHRQLMSAAAGWPVRLSGEVEVVQAGYAAHRVVHDVAAEAASRARSARSSCGQPDRLTASFAHAFPDHWGGFWGICRRLPPHIICLQAVQQVAVPFVGTRFPPRHGPSKSAKVPGLRERHPVVDARTAKGRRR
ncbi:hypothetical protein GCM10023335_56060 [Streptomyces siamensis]|uniref:Uncharacterized protein n=1 Tax=Streptomyces siamensis TaxID=1274986 RepID=A0ABP9J7R6_9ACTN